MAGRKISDYFSSTTSTAVDSDSSECGLEDESESRPDPGGHKSESSPATKRPRCHTRTSGFNSARLNSFPWVLLAEDGEGMFCNYCRKHSCRPSKVPVGKAAWVDIPNQLQRTTPC